MHCIPQTAWSHGLWRPAPPEATGQHPPLHPANPTRAKSKTAPTRNSLVLTPTTHSGGRGAVSSYKHLDNSRRLLFALDSQKPSKMPGVSATCGGYWRKWWRNTKEKRKKPTKPHNKKTRLGGCGTKRRNGETPPAPGGRRKHLLPAQQLPAQPAPLLLRRGTARPAGRAAAAPAPPPPSAPAARALPGRAGPSSARRRRAGLPAPPLTRRGRRRRRRRWGGRRWGPRRGSRTASSWRAPPHPFWGRQGGAGRPGPGPARPSLPLAAQRGWAGWRQRFLRPAALRRAVPLLPPRAPGRRGRGRREPAAAHRRGGTERPRGAGARGVPRPPRPPAARPGHRRAPAFSVPRACTRHAGLKSSVLRSGWSLF